MKTLGEDCWENLDPPTGFSTKTEQTLYAAMMIHATRDSRRTLRETLAHLGPGIILAGFIIGSGELIATTTVDAEAGFRLLWLIVIGCGIKFAPQTEFDRRALAI